MEGSGTADLVAIQYMINILLNLQGIPSQRQYAVHYNKAVTNPDPQVRSCARVHRAASYRSASPDLWNRIQHNFTYTT
jgi:hypothetical protein